MLLQLTIIVCEEARYEKFIALRSETSATVSPSTYDDDGAKLAGESDDSEEEDDEFRTFESEPVAEIALGNARNVIDKLYRLSFKIRNPAMRLGFSKAKNYRDVDATTNVDLIQQFVLVDQRHVQEIVAHFRGISSRECTNDFLAHRLARANTYRRQQIGQWRSHRIKMEIVDEENLLPRTNRSAKLLQENLPRAGAPSLPTTATKVPDMRLEANDSYDTESMVSTSTYVVLSKDSRQDEIVVPKLPSSLKAKKEFECPFCCTLCSGRLAFGQAWQWVLPCSV